MFLPDKFKKLQSKLSDFPAAIIVYASQFSGGDDPHPYLSGEISIVVAGFIPALPDLPEAEWMSFRSVFFKSIEYLKS
jgi:hypothetical protein